MNWTGGHLQQSKRKQNGITTKQKSYFAKSHLRNLTSKRTAPNNSSDHQHPHHQSLRLCVQDTNQQILEPPEWLPKELCDSFLQTQSQLETRPRKAFSINKHGKRQHSKETLRENGKVTHPEDTGKFQVSKDAEDEVKRQNLLLQKDWFTTSKSSYNYRPPLHDRSRIGKRRKLKQDDLARIVVQHKRPTSKSNLNFVTADNIFKPSQVSIRLGSQIHGTQRTTLSSSKVQVKATPASGITIKGSKHRLTTSDRSIQPLKETPIRSVASFQALEEMVTPPQEVSHSRAKRSKIERWISESALKGRYRDDFRPRQSLNDKQVTQSPQSLNGEAGSSGRGSQQLRRLARENTDHRSHRKRHLESDGSCNQEPSIILPMKHSPAQDESRTGNKLKTRQIEIHTKQTRQPVLTENTDIPNREQSTTSFLLESNTNDTNTIASPASRSVLPPSSLVRKLDGFPRPKELSSFHSLTASPCTNILTKGGVSNDAARSYVSQDLPKASLTLAQRQNEEWLQWIISLRQWSKENETVDVSETSRQQISTSPTIQSTKLTNATPISARSTYVHTDNTPKLETLVEVEDLSARELDYTTNRFSSKVTPAKGNNSHILPHTSNSYFATPTAQQSLDVPQPRTPAKNLIQRRSISRDGNHLDSEAIDLREKFLQVASLPFRVQPKSKTKPNPMVDTLTTLPPTCQNQTEVSKEINDSRVHAILHDDGVALSKSVSRSLVFIKPQRFEDISQSKKTIIGNIVSVPRNEQTDSKYVAHLGKSNLEKDDIED